MGDSTEAEYERALELFDEFVTNLEETNRKLETAADWYDAGTPLDGTELQQEIKTAQSLYTMASNVLDNTDYSPEHGELYTMASTERVMEKLSEYRKIPEID